MLDLRPDAITRRHPLEQPLPEVALLQPAARPAGLLRSLPLWLPFLLILLAALLPRVAELNDFYTTDEAYFWQARVARFTAAVQMGDWAATNQTGHPGVTTMWLGSLGQQFARLVGVAPTAQGDGAAFLAYLRLPLALTNTLAVLVGYLLLRRLLHPATAMLAGVLWAASPFLIAHSRLLHLDALLTSFFTLSLLCLLLATRPPPEAGSRRRPWLALAASGLLAGLALITKAPALMLLPLAALLLLLAALRGRPLAMPALLAGLRASVGPYLLWLAVAALTCFALWPALWVGPGAAIGSVIEEVVANGAQPHNAGNFFMGQPVADPGWSFYGLVVIWRGEVPTLLGLGALLLIGARHLWARPDRPPRAVLLPEELRLVVALAAFALIFTLCMTLLAKKFDRYLLPIWPSMEILAAIGVVGLLRLLGRSLGPLTAWGRYSLAAAVALAILLPSLIYRPYYLAYFNPLLGGGTTAQAVLLTGWGEGMEQAGAWLRARPDLRRGPILSWLPNTLAPFVPADVAIYDLDLDRLNQPANYAVIYNSVAERDTREVAEAYAMQTPPLYTLRVRGITYITIHQLPRPFERSVGAVFSGIHLRGYSSELRANSLLVTPSWDIQVDRAGGVFSFVHVLDSAGQRVAQLDTLLDDGLFPEWQAGQQFGTPLPVALPSDLAPGEYQVVLGLYTQPDGARVPLSFGEALPESLAGPHAIQLFQFSVGEDALGPLAE